jgi:uncharacterized membrane protein YeiH
VDALLKTIEVLGILAFALTGVAEARKKGMDIVGVYFVSMITAFGGGSVRDLVLDRHPLFWISQYQYPIVLLGLALVSTVVRRPVYDYRFVKVAVIALDALGLGLFGALGTYYAEQAGCMFFVALLMGVVTGIFGGVMRDMICNEIPLVFKHTELYATCAALGCAAFVLMVAVGAPVLAATLVCIGVTAAVRLAAVKYNIMLPRWLG